MFYVLSEKQKKIADFMRKHETEIVIGRRMTYIIKRNRNMKKINKRETNDN